MEDANRQGRSAVESEHIRNQETHYKEIIRTSMDGFLVHDRDGRILDVNDAYCKLTEFSREELLGMRLSDVEMLENSREVAGHIEKIMALGSDRFVSRHRRSRGGSVDVEVSVTYSGSGDGIFVSFLRDITERLRLENELRLKGESYRTLVENSPT